MKYSIIALIVLVASGCTADNSGETCDTIHSYTEQQTDATGIILKPSEEMYVTFETVSKLYQETQACMGMTAPAPIVSYESFRQRIGALGGWGVYVASGAEVWINKDIDEYIPRNCHSDADTLRHEYVHHILHMNDMGEVSRSHSSPMFAQCGIGVYVLNGTPAAQ